jgi:prefoldin subunit 5
VEKQKKLEKEKEEIFQRIQELQHRFERIDEELRDLMYLVRLRILF